MNASAGVKRLELLQTVRELPAGMRGQGQ